MKYGNIIHLGIVVANLEESIGYYESVLGIGPWEIEEPEPFFAQMQVSDPRGLHIRTATFRGGPCEIELVQPTGEGPYADWLREKGPSMHHIKFECAEDYDTETGTISEASGRPPYLEVRHPEGFPIVAYADFQKETGLLVEVPGRRDQ